MFVSPLVDLISAVDPLSFHAGNIQPVCLRSARFEHFELFTVTLHGRPRFVCPPGPNCIAACEVRWSSLSSCCKSLVVAMEMNRRKEENLQQAMQFGSYQATAWIATSEDIAVPNCSIDNYYIRDRDVSASVTTQGNFHRRISSVTRKD